MPLGDRPPEPLSSAEMAALMAACEGTSLSAKRNKALVVTLWRGGLRCAEALALRPSDVDFGAGTVRVLRGKGRKARTVGLDDSALAVIREWMDVRSAAGVVSGPLFCRTRQLGLPLSSRYVRKLLATLGAKAGIVHRVHPHGLRHTYTVELAREGWPVPLISRSLGHSNVGTTDTYLAGLHPVEAVRLARARSWQ